MNNNSPQEAKTKVSTQEEVLTSLQLRIEEINKRSQLKILIWGPGSNGVNKDIYDKRCQIRDGLIRQGHIAHFSEEVWTPARLQASGLNVTVGEFLQAELYDYIICLMVSPGTIGEVHDFAKIPKFAARMMICIDNCHQVNAGYSVQGTIKIFEGLNGKIDWFQYPKDISECHLATRIMAQLNNVSHAKQHLIIAGGDTQ